MEKGGKKPEFEWGGYLGGRRSEWLGNWEGGEGLSRQSKFLTQRWNNIHLPHHKIVYTEPFDINLSLRYFVDHFHGVGV